MNKWRFALQKRWFGYLGVAILFAIICVMLSNWQLSRRDEREVEIDRVNRNFDATPVQIEDVLPTLDGFNENDRWLPVEVTGTYLPEKELLVRNRPHDGQPGYEILTPLQLDNGNIFVVNRGWIPTGNDADRPESVPRPPSGEVTVVARLKAGEAEIKGRGAPEGQLATIRLDDAAATFGQPTYTGAYGLLASESPESPDPRPAEVKRPEPDEGPHLSYAFQWIIFALMAFGFLGYAVREEYRRVNSDDPEENRRATERARKKALRVTDADIEDELLDGKH
ncbi:SURF1 family cytochrome oxidase biogenesis protein [Mycetocola spongiae]|uniref:SURF1 family cytochrome oxidase biogenesis protein n=1 Tax=Mycetocola spongiae TaxID=2859226 RepID=UPI001CF4BE11|nr:SURF1 family cytochrome oxidase biogenesis protein [Mycetocola spongiae]UCR89689.1 SURF1 family protein [Mycetocola spongiae]